MIVKITPAKIDVDIASNVLNISTGTPIAKEYINADPYTGSYSATPTLETQVFSTENLRMTEDFIVNPIPSNYGLITWDGSTLTVS